MATKRTDPAGAARVIRTLQAELEADRLVDDVAPFGEQVVRDIAARGSAVGVPRQAHLVAGSFRYDRAAGVIALDASAQAGQGTAGELVFGAELGSDRFLQFGPRRSGGTWLFPILREPGKAAIEAGERALDELIGGAL